MSDWIKIGTLGFFATLNVLSFFIMLYQAWEGIPGQLKYVNLILNPLSVAVCAYVAYDLWCGI